jgi:hypothetical protein
LVQQALHEPAALTGMSKDARRCALDEWMFCMSVMYERMSNAQVRVELCIKCFGEKDILREHFWSPRNDDVIISYKFFL